MSDDTYRPLATDNDWANAIRDLGGEPFATGKATKLWGLPVPEYEESSLGQFVVVNPMAGISVVTSDVERHELVKGSTFINMDGQQFSAKGFEPDGERHGMTVIRFSE